MHKAVLFGFEIWYDIIIVRISDSCIANLIKHLCYYAADIQQFWWFDKMKAGIVVMMMMMVCLSDITYWIDDDDNDDGGEGLCVGVFDISISHIDYRYIDTFWKYRYRYR